MDINVLLAILTFTNTITTLSDQLGKLVQFIAKSRKCKRFKKDIDLQVQSINLACEKIFGKESKEIGRIINKFLTALPVDGGEIATVANKEEMYRLDAFYNDLVIDTLRKMRDLKQCIYEYGKLCVAKKGQFKLMLYKVDDSCKDALSMTYSKIDPLGLSIMQNMGIEEQNARRLLEIIKSSDLQELKENPYVEKIFSVLEEIRAVGKNAQGAYDF